MSKPGAIIAPPSQNVSDMLAILADPSKYRQHLDELKAMHKDIEGRLGLYNQLDKIQAYHKDVKEQAAAASKSKAEADALWARLEQAGKELTSRKHALESDHAAREQAQVEARAAHARDVSAHLSALAAHEQAVAALAEDRAKLRTDQARHDARMAKAKEKLAAVTDAIKGVEAL